MTTDTTSMLRGFWYIAAKASKLKTGKTRPVTILGEELLIGRDHEGKVFAYADRCPHRGMPMRHGTFDGANLHCCYHGWAFSAETGVCTAVPALADDDPTSPARFRLRAFPCQDVQGNIWVYIPAGRTVPETLPPVPQVPGFDGVAPQISTTMQFPSNAEIATYGFCDPAHPAFVHTSRWWKSKSALKLRPKSKEFEPAEYGFRMKTHVLKGGARPYRLLGTDVRVDVTVSLPGLRIEHIRGSRHSACVLAAVTPSHAVNHRSPLLRLLDNPLARPPPPPRRLHGPRLPPPRPRHGRQAGPRPGNPPHALRRRPRHPDRLDDPPKTRIPRQPCRRPSLHQPAQGPNPALEKLTATPTPHFHPCSRARPGYPRRNNNPGPTPSKSPAAAAAQGHAANPATPQPGDPSRPTRTKTTTSPTSCKPPLTPPAFAASNP